VHVMLKIKWGLSVAVLRAAMGPRMRCAIIVIASHRCAIGEYPHNSLSSLLHV